MIDGKNFGNQSMKKITVTHDGLRNILKGNLLDYLHLRDHFEITALDLTINNFQMLAQKQNLLLALSLAATANTLQALL